MEAEKSFYYRGFTSISLSDIMDLRHQSNAMCIIMLGGEDGVGSQVRKNKIKFLSSNKISEECEKSTVD